MDNRTPPITGTTTPTPAQPAAPFDPDTLPPHLRAGLDQFSDICIDALALIYARRAAAAEAATIAEAAHANEERINEVVAVRLKDGVDKG